MEKAASLPIDEVFDDLNTSAKWINKPKKLNCASKNTVTTSFQKKDKFHSYTNSSHIFKDLFGILLLVAAILSYISGSPELALIILGSSFRQHFRQHLPGITCRKSHGNPEKLDA